MIRILIVDDHQLVRLGTRRLLEAEEGFEIVGEADSGETAIEQVRALSPDVVLMDVQMPGMGGLEATRRCLRVDPDLRVIVVTLHEEQPFPSRMLDAGASGYLTKNAGIEEMTRAIRRVMSGQRYLCADVAQEMALRPYKGDDASPFEALSSREMQISLLVIAGHGSTDIATQLSLSPKTVNSYRYRVFDKLGVSNDVGLTRMAIMHGLVSN